MRSRILNSILIFIFLILFYSTLFVALMQNYEGRSYSIVDGFYWVIATITTVGYGDIYFTTPAGKIFSVVVMVSGVLYFFGFLLPYAIIPWAEERLKLVLPTSVKMSNHIIICGYNLFTVEFCKILREFGVNYVVLEKDPERVRRALDDRVVCVLTSGSERSFLENGVERANAMIVAWDRVEDILDTLLTLKEYGIPKYVVYGDYRYTKYLLYAGAKKVFLPKSLIASSIARMILQEVEIGKRREIFDGVQAIEIVLPSNISVSELEERGLRVIAACRLGNLEFNPPKDRILEKGCVALLAGTEEAIKGIVYEGTHFRLR
jgi:voltage-gated potassium channel